MSQPTKSLNTELLVPDSQGLPPFSTKGASPIHLQRKRARGMEEPDPPDTGMSQESPSIDRGFSCSEYLLWAGVHGIKQSPMCVEESVRGEEYECKNLVKVESEMYKTASVYICTKCSAIYSVQPYKWTKFENDPRKSASLVEISFMGPST
jgi:hypothetical protein